MEKSLKVSMMRRLHHNGNLNGGNIPNDFVEIKIRNKQVKLTAMEMKTFWTFLPFIIGSAIPVDDPVWNFLKTTLQLG